MGTNAVLFSESWIVSVVRILGSWYLVGGTRAAHRGCLAQRAIVIYCLAVAQSTSSSHCSWSSLELAARGGDVLYRLQLHIDL